MSTVQVEDKEKSLKEKAQAESFYTEEEVFSAARINFLCWLNVMTPNKSLE